MGARTSHMNIYNISHVTQLSVANCANILTFIEDPALDPQTLIFGVKTYKKAEPIKRADSENSIDNHSEKSDIIPVPIIIVDIPPVDENKLFMLTVPECHRILDIFQVLPSDKDTIIQLFRLLDKNGSKVVDIRDVFISILVVISKSVKECIDAAFLLYNRGNNLTRIKTVGSSTSTSDENIDRKMVSNKSLFHILSLLNISCSYFSDKYLEQSQVEDLVDSVFATSSSSSSSLASTSPSKSSHTSVSENGKIKRLNFYEFSDVIVLHPLLEMMISIQFQGPLKDKMEL